MHFTIFKSICGGDKNCWNVFDVRSHTRSPCSMILQQCTLGKTVIGHLETFIIGHTWPSIFWKTADNLESQCISDISGIALNIKHCVPTTVPAFCEVTIKTFLVRSSERNPWAEVFVSVKQNFVSPSVISLISQNLLPRNTFFNVLPFFPPR